MYVDPMNDEKVQTVLNGLENGRSKGDIAEEYGLQWKSIDMYMRRRGFKWSTEQQNYVLKDNEALNDDTVILNTKAAQIVRLLDVINPNIRQTANKMGFESIDMMGDYMKSQGYLWNDELNNYEFKPELLEKEREQPLSLEPVSELLVDEQAFLHTLMQHKQRLLEILTTEQQLYIYRFRGNKVNKTLTLASGVVTLLEDYNKEYNITQRQIVETALAEFFDRHGYANQLKNVTI